MYLNGINVLFFYTCLAISFIYLSPFGCTLHFIFNYKIKYGKKHEKKDTVKISQKYEK